jgi:hypothetical protein
MFRNFSLHFLRFRQFHKAQFVALCIPHRFTPSISKSRYFLELISPPTLVISALGWLINPDGAEGE